jgi:hypothetical protein
MSKKNLVRRTILSIDLAIYSIYIIIGFMFINFTKCCYFPIVKNVYLVFFILAMLFILAHFLNKRNNDYEFLTNALICVLTGSYILMLYDLGNINVVIQNAILLFAILIIMNKWFNTCRLYNQKNINFFPKLIVTLLTILYGLFTLIILYNKFISGSFGYLLLSHFFLIIGVICLIEPLTLIVMRSPYVESYLLKKFKFEEEKPKKKPTRLKEIRKKKPIAKTSKKD